MPGYSCTDTEAALNTKINGLLTFGRVTGDKLSDNDNCIDKYFQTQTEDFIKELKSYQAYLNKAVDLNEVYNANQYIGTIHTHKQDRLKAILADLKNRENMLRQRARQYYYSQKRQEMYNNFIRYIIILFNLVFIFAALYKMEKMGKALFITISTVCASILLSIVMFSMLSANQRRKEDWNKYNWAPMIIKS